MVSRARLRAALHDAWTGYVEMHRRGPFKLRYATLIGLVGHPLYYWMWTYVFPQPFESLSLRLGSMALCLVLFLGTWWPASLRPFYLPYAYLTTLLCLPAFFTLMLLMNGGNPVWLMSTMASFLLVVLLCNLPNTILVSIAGSLIGIVVFFCIEGVRPLPTTYVATFPIYLFTIAAVLFLAYSERAIAAEKLMAAHALASNIAHEMRTPLLGIRLDCDRLRADLPVALAAAQWAAANGYEGPRLSPTRYDLIDRALKRIGEHTLGANLVIEMLLVNVRHERIASEGFAPYSIAEVIETALNRYHFRRGERDLVSVRAGNDFTFVGSDVLMIHVLFNMLKNSLSAIEAKGSGTVSIAADAAPEGNMLIIRDTGAGIPPDILPFIFMPFVTGDSRMQGTGIGLSFCKLVVESFGGRMSCESDTQSGTTFTITLPPAAGPLSGAGELPVLASSS